jgi:hypothetical protein
VLTLAQGFQDEGKQDESGEQNIQLVEARKDAAIAFEPTEEAFDFISAAV